MLRKLNSFSRSFLRFAAISGCGWLIDFCLMLAMVFLFSLNVGVANFISSFVAVTFVWLIALRVVFTKKYKGNSFFGPCSEGGNLYRVCFIRGCVPN